MMGYSDSWLRDNPVEGATTVVDTFWDIYESKVDGKVTYSDTDFYR